MGAGPFQFDRPRRSPDSVDPMTGFERVSSHGQPSLGETMGVITIRCPSTGEQVSTGLVIDVEAFAIIGFLGHRFRCDACNEVHGWDKKDATFQPDKAPG